MRRWGLLAIGSVLLAALATAPVLALTPAQLPRSAASYASREVFDRKYNEAYTYRAGGSIDCKHRGGFNVRHCRAHWVVGDTGFVGWTRVALYEKPNRSKVAVVGYRLRVIDEYCIYAEKRSPQACTRHERGRAQVTL